MLEDALQQHIKDVYEGTMGTANIEAMQVPDLEEIERKRIENETTIDCDDIEMHIVKKVYDRLANGASYVDVPELGNTLLKSPDVNPILGKKCREPKGVSDIPRETFTEVFSRMAQSKPQKLPWRSIKTYFT